MKKTQNHPFSALIEGILVKKTNSKKKKITKREEKKKNPLLCQILAKT